MRTIVRSRCMPKRGGGGRALRLCALATAVLLFEVGAASAQQQPRISVSPDVRVPSTQIMRPADPEAKMLVQANELIYDYQNDQVAASGQVQIYYDGAVLEADRVTFDRRANRLFAHGNVRFQAKDGNILHGEMIELTDDFRDGFVESLLVETTEQTRFAAARGRRSDGNITVFESGVYTACEPCRDDPQRPPLWQVKATRIVHNEGERIIHYENASIEFFGVPIAWFPYFWHPDGTVKRQSGFLLPTFFSNERIGVGVNIPYFWAVAPNADVTVSVAPLTRQIGPLVTAEWRHRLMKGAYTIRASGIFQQDKEAFRDRGAGSPGVKDFRGAIETSGRFKINERWNWGWDGTLLTDRFFFADYSEATDGGGSERVSQVFLTGQGERSYFDVRAMGFHGLTRLDEQDQLPIIHPVLDYSYVFDRPILGGELGFRTNVTSLSRQNAEFNSIAPGISNEDCMMAADPGECMMRGMAGDYTRFSSEANWRRTLTNSWGMVFKPFASVRADVASLNVKDDVTGTSDFINTGHNTLVRAMPTAGMEVRWPFISVHSWGTQVVEPIGQLIVRPNESQIGRFPNEDAQSLVFDDSNLFAIDKYSGYDRVEGGTRANVGVQYTANIHRYGMVNVLFGQSYHLFGRNSFAYSGITDGTGQQTGLGLQSGLETDRSDYVARIYYQPIGNISFTSRFRFDKNDFSVRRFELETRSSWGPLALGTIYARYEEQPRIGFTERREAIYQTAALKMHENWSIFGGVRYDLKENRLNLGMVGLSYIDECFAATLSYQTDRTSSTYTRPVHRIMLRINLRTIGDTSFSTQLGSEQTQ